MDDLAVVSAPGLFRWRAVPALSEEAVDIAPGARLRVWFRCLPPRRSAQLALAASLALTGPAQADVGSWLATSSAGAPAGRIGHTSVWTGTKMIVWGGDIGIPLYRNDGGVYDPATDTWMAMNAAGAPAGRTNHTSVWTGTRMIVWGGYDGDSGMPDGGIYDPASDSWTAVSTTGSPAGSGVAVWTGTKMIVWAGRDGGIYDPATDTWTAMNTTGAPHPAGGQTAVWAGTKMIVWGGNDGNPRFDGGVYDPATDSWTAMNVSGAAGGGTDCTAVSTGAKMIVWGGYGTHRLLPRCGAIYDPATDTWTALSKTGEPARRTRHTAVWAGTKMLVWGGVGLDGLRADGGVYDPATDTWAALSTTGAPASRYEHTSVWTGTRMIVWGGSDGTHYRNDGGLYDPRGSGPTPRTLPVWHDFFAVDLIETPYVGDFNGDGLTDIITFTRQNPLAFGDVYVALSNGSQFVDRSGSPGSSDKWHDWFAIDTSELVVIGDYDGDGKDDIATWLSTSTRQVYVALSQGTGMGQERVWVDSIGLDPSDVLMSGDANGDGKKDLVCFARKQGKVYVALSDGTKFGEPEIWHPFFAVSTYERPQVADVNGDGKADIVTFATDSPTAFGDVYVATSDGTKFVARDGTPNSDKWADWFAIRPTERVRIADLDGDGKDDFFTFLPPPWGQCYTTLSEGTQMGPNELWPVVVTPYQMDKALVGDVDGDGKADIIVFGQSEGKVYVSLARQSFRGPVGDPHGGRHVESRGSHPLLHWRVVDTHLRGRRPPAALRQ